MTADGTGVATTVDEAAFRELHRRLDTTGRWGADDDRGTLGEITPERVLAAVAEVRSGVTVSLAAPVRTVPTPDNADPCRHGMTSPPESRAGTHGLHFALDRFAMNVHGDTDSHLDALAHVVYDGSLHGGVPATAVTPDGASVMGVDTFHDGIVGRGVLLDVPRLRGVPWLEPGDHVTCDDLTAAEEAQGVRVGRGDLLFVRVGHRRRRDALGPWDTAHHRAGLHPSAMPLLAERGVALLGSDGNNDTAPSSTDGVGFPVHVLAVHAMGLPLLDYLRFEDLARLCERRDRWSFLCVVAPLRLPRATGSPVNPVAVL